MRRRTLLALAVLVAGLLFLVRRQSEEVAQVTSTIEYPLFPDFDQERVVALRLEDTRRASQLGLERDAEGRWFVVDPVAYPADEDVVRTVLRQLQSLRCVPAGELDPATLELEPPDIVLTATEADGADGTPGRRLRVELGRVDLDERRVFARVPGHPAARNGLLRVGRELAVLLDRPPDDFRQARLVPYDAGEIISFRRRAALRLEPGADAPDLTLDAKLLHEGWRRIDPPSVALDPVAIGALVRGATDLRAQKFVIDHPEAPADYGLDPAEITIDLETELGVDVLLELGRRVPGSEAWYCVVAGTPNVVQVDVDDVLLLTRPADLLYDYRLVRALRDDLRRVVFARGEHELAIEREGDDWWVSEGGERFPASHDRVEDLLGTLERQELAGYLRGTPFDPGDPPRRLTITTAQGLELGGEVGAPGRSAETGAEGWHFRRYGDEMTGLVGAEVVRWFDVPLESWRRRQIHRYDEQLVDRVHLVQGARSLSYERRNETEWYPEGVRTRLPFDSGFFPVLEGLRSLRATEWLAPGDALALDPEVEVRLEGTFPGKERRFTLGRDAAGRSVCRLPEGEVAEIDPDLLEGVLALLGG